MTISEAITLFDSGKEAEAFFAFADLYNTSRDTQERKDIMRILMDAYYLPNEAALKAQYQKNITLLSNYPFFYGAQFKEYSDLSFRLFPVTDDIAYHYDAEADCFLKKYVPNLQGHVPYFFEHLENPLFIADEDNFYNLQFLNDNVRRSEDYGADNHIYLYYQCEIPLERLLIYCDLESILQDQKFVFLCGQQNEKKYPLNFQEEFGIDYSETGPAPIRPEEVKRICYWYKHAHSGSIFTMDVLNCSPYVQRIIGHDFYVYSKINGQCIGTQQLKELYADYEKSYTLQEIENFLAQPENEICLAEVDNALSWAKATWPQREEYSVKNLFLLYCLYFYQKKKFTPRIIPIIVFDPHVWDNSMHNPLIQSFPYYKVLTCMRDPIRMIVSSYKYGLIGWRKFQTKYMMASDYAHAMFLAPEMRKEYYGIRFEDLKTNPEPICKGMCTVLNIPFAPEMLQMNTANDDCYRNEIRGFDQSALHRDLSCELSEFDQFRLRIFYAPILDYYGYSSFSPEEYPLSEEMIEELLSYPLRFERYNHLNYPDVPQSTLHQWIQDVFKSFRNAPFVSPKLISITPFNPNYDEQWREFKSTLQQ